ncbi:MAG: hypothetical protein AAFZ89_01705 [Bacteroidota bacterium]
MIRDFKKHTAKKILESIKNEPESRREWMLEQFSRAARKHGRNKTYQFWKYGNPALRSVSLRSPAVRSLQLRTVYE